MKNQTARAELPIISNNTLPYLPVHRISFPKTAIIPVVTMMLATAGLMAFAGKTQPLFIASFVVEMISVVIILFIAVRQSRKKTFAWAVFEQTSESFIETARLRYNVVLTQTILSRLAQGGSTLLPDAKGSLTRIVLESDPETLTSKLVTHLE